MTVLIAGLTAVPIWYLIWRRWQRGLEGLVIAMPLMGALALWLYPAVWPRALKDLFLIGPLYLSVIANGVLRQAIRQTKKSLIVLMILLSALTLAECFNPHVMNWKMAFIGAKVWLSYLPLLPLGMLWLQNDRDRLRALRCIVWSSLLPAIVALIQWFGDYRYGYVSTMTAFYGEAAAGACQNFASFLIGNQYIFRVPGTFTFAAQLYCYLFSVIPMAYSLIRMETSPARRVTAQALFWLLIFTGFICGVRAAYIFIPLLLLTIYVLDRRPVAGFGVAAISVLLLLFSLQAPILFAHPTTNKDETTRVTVPIPLAVNPALKPNGKTPIFVMPTPTTRTVTIPVSPAMKNRPDPAMNKLSWRLAHIKKSIIDMRLWSHMMTNLVIGYGSHLVMGTFIDSLRRAPFGEGTGTNTGAARYVVPHPESFFGVENYFSKTVMELGFPGLLILAGLFGIIVASGFKGLRAIDLGPQHSLLAALVAYLVLTLIYNFKGLALDLDPMNVFFWLFSGILLRLTSTPDGHAE